MAFLGDALIVHPIAEGIYAQRDAIRICWGGFGIPGRYVSDCGTLLVRLIGMPIVFLADWGVRLVGLVLYLSL